MSHGETYCGTKYLTTMSRQLGLKREELVQLVERSLMTIPFRPVPRAASWFATHTGAAMGRPRTMPN
jgi:hypothetical protein